MAKFKYRMQNVLNIKLKLEDQAKMLFAEENAKLNEEERRLNQIKERRQQYEKEGKRLRSAALNVVHLKENHTAIENLKTIQKAQEDKVEEAAREVERARRFLQNAMQERKTQEKLYEDAFAEFMKDENARESKEVDELTSYTYGQRKREEMKLQEPGEE